MEVVLKQFSEDNHKMLFVDIVDVGGGRSNLICAEWQYMSTNANNGWKSFTVADIESMVRHSNGNLLMVAFMGSSLPFWRLMNVGLEVGQYIFNSVNILLTHFQ